jgi:hypothetical protein
VNLHHILSKTVLPRRIHERNENKFNGSLLDGQDRFRLESRDIKQAFGVCQAFAQAFAQEAAASVGRIEGPIPVPTDRL